MSITALSGIVATTFTPKQENEETPTRFKIEPLNGLEYLEMLQHMREGRITYEGMRLALNKLKGWENFNDSDGVEIAFTEANIRRIPPLTINKIVQEIVSNSELTAEKRKN